MVETATMVDRVGDEYVALTDDEEPIARAGALNFKGKQLSFDADTRIHFNQSHVQVANMHAHGVLLVE